MASLFGYGKNLSKVQRSHESAKTNKNFWYSFYMDYFTKLATNYFLWENLGKGVDPTFIEKQLFFNGYCCYVNDDKLNEIVLKGATGYGLDIYGNPLKFTPVTIGTDNRFILKREYDLVWYDDTKSENFSNLNKGVLIQNDDFRSPQIDYITTFCLKLADIEQTIQINRDAQLRPYIITANDRNIFSMKNFFNKIMAGEPVIYVKEQQTKQGEMDYVQLSDRVNVLNTNTPFLLDKLHDEKQRVINQCLTFLGINNNAVDKAERLVSAEATSNNGLINASIQIRLRSRELAVCLLNDLLQREDDNLITVKPNPNIKMFNTEEVYEDIENEIEQI